MLNFLKKAQRLKTIVGLMFVSLGLAMLWQPATHAAGSLFDGVTTSTVRPEDSDQAMFGKPLSATYNAPSRSVNDLKPGSSPVVPARLRIPAVGIDTNVEQVGLHEGAMDVPGNIWNVGWLKTSPRPGDVGNAVIDGHKDSINGGAVFRDLHFLKAGDRIYISDEGGSELTFEVTELQSYSLSDAQVGRIFGRTDNRQLNLITCDGTFNADQHTYDKRLVVYTRLVTGK